METYIRQVLIKEVIEYVDSIAHDYDHVEIPSAIVYNIAHKIEENFDE